MGRSHQDPPLTADGASPSARVAFEGIEKRFGGVPVLRGVTLEVAPGEVLGLVGENGAGKSTLMNILGGSLQPDGGRLRVDGRAFAPRSPADARTAGVAFVHQELTLFPNLTIAENLHLTDFPRRMRLPWIDRAAARRAAARLLARVGLAQPPDTPVERLTSGERQLVEIARALGARARVLILDEPTSSLGAADRERLLDLVRDLRRQGLSIIYISHELGEVLRLCDRVAVLRDGEVAGAGPAAGFSIERLVTLMVGREVRRTGTGRNVPPAAAAPLLEVRDLREPGVASGISLTLHRGELLGVFGLMGAGRSELARMVFGLDAHTGGEILLEGRVLAGGPRERIAAGLALVTEDRRGEGLCLEASIADNMSLVHLGSLTRTALRIVNGRALGEAVRRMSAAVRLSGATDPRQAAGRLSGGNQQKVVLAKWLAGDPRVLILDEPTRGIDVGARAEIYDLLRQLAGRGAGVLVISSELEELTELCDRILVMRRGAISGTFERGAFDREQILRAALPARVSA